MEIQHKEIILRIKELIREMNLTQADFSRRTKINPANLSNILHAKVAIGPTTINKIIIAFDVNREWLESGEGEMFAEITDKNTSKKTTDKNISIPPSVMEVIIRQAASLEAKDRQIDELIRLLNSNNELSDVSATNKKE